MSFPDTFYRWRPHPWHGLETGPSPPDRVSAYIELTPFDRVKYEIDKTTGYMRVDRPQRTSAQPPSLYGFVPRTYCGRRVGDLSPAQRGDGDPLDICVISEQPIHRGEVLVHARVVGGLQMVDEDEADDKIVAVLEGDLIWRETREISELPQILVERLHHYFSTYKRVPGTESQISIEQIYGRDHACAVVEAAMADYRDEFGE
ncbi:MAG: inorganic pyrophosphatase [Acidobacteriota bacterium]